MNNFFSWTYETIANLHNYYNIQEDVAQSFDDFSTITLERKQRPMRGKGLKIESEVRTMKGSQNIQSFSYIEVWFTVQNYVLFRDRRQNFSY